VKLAKVDDHNALVIQFVPTEATKTTPNNPKLVLGGKVYGGMISTYHDKDMYFEQGFFTFYLLDNTTVDEKTEFTVLFSDALTVVDPVIQELSIN